VLRDAVAVHRLDRQRLQNQHLGLMLVLCRAFSREFRRRSDRHRWSQNAPVPTATLLVRGQR
jgi:hypothetical protein